MLKTAILDMADRIRRLLIAALVVLLMPALLQAAGQRYNPWSYAPDGSYVPSGTRPWANIPPAQPSQRPRQPNSRHEPPVAPQYYSQPYYSQPYPYQDYMSTPYTDPYSGYGHLYNPYLLPGYGGMNGIYPGLYGGPSVPGTLYPYPAW